MAATAARSEASRHVSQRSYSSAEYTRAHARSRTYHPDRATGAEAHFIHIRQAYEVLTDPVKRYAYDRCVLTPPSLRWSVER